MRNNVGAAKALIDAGARTDLPDKNGRTPVDWAVLRHDQTVVDLLVGGRAEQDSIAAAPARSPTSPSPMLETGIKIIDLFAPLVRGGLNGILTPHTNVGSFVLLTELALRMDRVYGSRTICLGLDDESFTRRDMQLLIRDAGVSDAVSVIFGSVDDSAQERSGMLDLAVAKAKDLRAEGREVLVLVMNHIAVYEEFMKRLKSLADKDAITTIYFGAETAGAEPAAIANLDAVIGFDFGRAKRALYPAVDPLNSRSRLLEERKASKEHQYIAAEARRLLRRYQDLQPIIESRGLDLVPKDEDPSIVERASRLDRFLTQPFHWTEPWTNVPGVHVSLTETLEGCRAILEGECDDMPEEAFHFIGNLESLRERAKHGETSTVTKDTSP
jgi:F-type H+-transporting ATPase subunit beta